METQRERCSTSKDDPVTLSSVVSIAALFAALENVGVQLNICKVTHKIVNEIP